MKNLFSLICGLVVLFCNQSNAQDNKNKLQTTSPISNTKSVETKSTKTMNKLTIYSYKVKDIDGKEFDFLKLKGKKILIVNTASECGYTPQYKELEELYQKYKKENFVIVGFPTNNFGGQEPGTNKEIKAFCTKNYGVTFPMMEKVSVDGKDKCDIYEFLTQKGKNGLEDSTVEWNFQKYLINENGELIAVFPSKITPMSEEITSLIN